MKGETVEEIAGMAETMRALATAIPATARPLVDTCGTGGDHSGTFNISTTAAFVTAGAGVHVAKHGNRSASSLCGSADVLEALGVNLDLSPERVAECIDQIGIGFLFARNLHTAMKHVGPIRAELKLRTVFNILGPLTNPAGADGQVMGVFDRNLIAPLAEVLLQLGSRHVFIVAGSDGLDELTLTGPSFVAEGCAGTVKTYEVTPEQFGLTRTHAASLMGGDPAANALILRAVLSGETGPRREIVLLNAAPALVAGGKADSLEEGIRVAQASIDSGAALSKLEELIRKTHDS
jgi:anthranilate phosphoribosyltransferase